MASPNAFESRCRALFSESLGHGRRWKSACAAGLGIGRATLYRYFEHGSAVADDVLLRLSSLEREQSAGAAPNANVHDMVRRYARALIDIQTTLDEDGSLRTGLPQSARRAFDLGAALNYAARSSVWPTDVARLVAVARKPLFEWVSDLSWDPEGDFAVARLVVAGAVSPECVCMAATGNDPDAELAENAGYRKLLALCDSLESPEARDAAYEAWRRFVITKPVVAKWTAEIYSDPLLASLESIDALVDLFYQPVSEVFARGGKLRLCTISGTVLRQNGSAYETECREPAAIQAARDGRYLELPYRPGILQLRRPFRMFWCLPGLTELKLEQHLVRAGWACRMWPALDRVDISATSPDGARRIAVDVKDYISPVRLAARFDGFKEFSRDHQCFLVVPDHVLVSSPMYAQRFEALRASKMRSPIAIRTLSGLLRELEGA